MTIPELKNRQRIDHFLRKFSTGTRLSLTEAAFAADFQSYSQFQRAFRKVMRMSPAAYRRKIQGTPTRTVPRDA
jgi:AraC-like DNA-binding protein